MNKNRYDLCNLNGELFDFNKANCMEKNYYWYFVELTNISKGLYYNVDLLTFEKLRQYFKSCIMDYQRTQAYDIFNRLEFNEKNDTQFLMNMEMGNEVEYKIGRVYIVYARSEEEALGKAIAHE